MVYMRCIRKRHLPVSLQEPLAAKTTDMLELQQHQSPMLQDCVHTPIKRREGQKEKMTMYKAHNIMKTDN